MFIFIGAAPHTDWLDGGVARDDRGFILAGADVAALDGDVRWPLARDRDPFLLESSLPGVFVAGDVRHRSIKRVASAVGEGSMAVQFIHEYLADA
jgi:thioredoxin reductase (NADPH)